MLSFWKFIVITGFVRKNLSRPCPTSRLPLHIRFPPHARSLPLARLPLIMWLLWPLPLWAVTRSRLLSRLHAHPLFPILRGWVHPPRLPVIRLLAALRLCSTWW